MGDPLTRRKSSEAVLVSVPGKAFSNPAAEPFGGGAVPNSTARCWQQGGAGRQGLKASHLTHDMGSPCPQGCCEGIRGERPAYGPPGCQGASGFLGTAGGMAVVAS